MQKCKTPLVPILGGYVTGIVLATFIALPLWMAITGNIILMLYFIWGKWGRDIAIILFFLISGNLLYQSSTLRQNNRILPIWTQNIRQNYENKIDTLFPQSSHAAVVKALVLGDKKDMAKENKYIFTESGTIHLMAVSGLHIGAIFFLFLTLFKTINFSRKWAMLLALIGVWCYALLSGLSPSTVRASLLLSFATLAYIFQVIYNPFNLCAASALIALLISPQLLFSLSFQLSYAAYIGIILALPILKYISRYKNRWLKYIIMSFTISIITQVFTAPLLLYYFHHLPLNGFIINIIAIPLATIILYSVIILIFLPSFIATFIAIFCSLLIDLLLLILHPFMTYGFSYSATSSFTLWEICMLFIVLFIGVLFGYSHKRLFYYLFLMGLIPSCIILFNHRQLPKGINMVYFNYKNHSTILIQEGRTCFFYPFNNPPLRIAQTYIRDKRLSLHKEIPISVELNHILWINVDSCDYNGESLIISNTSINPETIACWNHEIAPKEIIIFETQKNDYRNSWHNRFSQHAIKGVFIENNQIKRVNHTEIFR